jgi:hypothetical protein
MTFDGCLAGFDERLEAWLPPVDSGAMITYLVLPDVEAKKVKTHLPFVLFKRVRYAGFVGLEPQVHLGQPDLSAFFKLD